MPTDEATIADRWTRSPLTGVLSRSVGEWGHRLRLFQKRAGGPFYSSVNLTDGRRQVRSLGTADPATALRLAFGRLDPSGNTGISTCRVALGPLWERYRTECETFRNTGQLHQSDAASHAAILIAYFGPDYDVDRLSTDAQRRYERTRAAGGIRYQRVRRVVRSGRTTTETVWQVTPPTRARAAEADLVLLHAMLHWATTVRGADRARWLDANPLKGIDRRPEKNPRRPVTCQERYVATRRAIQSRAAQAPDDSAEQLRWIRLELALMLAEATGRRIGAIRQLRWEEIDYTRPAITWRADADKMGFLWTVDLPASLVADLRRFQTRLRAVGGWVFPGERLPDQPMDRWLLVKWLLVAERDAKLPKLIGGVWHPYRRKWAMERKHWPIRDVAAVGGWKNIRSLLECYAQADRETVLAVANEPRKLQAADLDPSQLATRLPWSPSPSNAAGQRASRPAGRCLRADRQRCRPPSRAMRPTGARAAPPSAESSTTTF